MIDYQTRLEPPRSTASRRGRKYGMDLIDEAIQLAQKVGYREAGKAMGIDYKMINRWVTAKRRENSSLQNELDRFDAKESNPFLKNPGVPEMLKAKLIMRVEIAREAIRMAERTRTSFKKCVMTCARQRGMDGNIVLENMSNGTIPKHWIMKQ